MIVKVDASGAVLCGWYALCDRPAAGTVKHPVLDDPVPTCERCADRHGLPLMRGTVTLDR